MTPNYPDFWPLSEFSPSVEDVKQAYVDGGVSDHALDNELEWAMEHPEPPAHVLIDADGAAVYAHNVELSPDLDELINDEANQITAEWESEEFQFNTGVIETQSYLTIECATEEVETVLHTLRGEPA